MEMMLVMMMMVNSVSIIGKEAEMQRVRVGMNSFGFLRILMNS